MHCAGDLWFPGFANVYLAMHITVLLSLNIRTFFSNIISLEGTKHSKYFSVNVIKS